MPGVVADHDASGAAALEGPQDGPDDRRVRVDVPLGPDRPEDVRLDEDRPAAHLGPVGLEGPFHGLVNVVVVGGVDADVAHGLTGSVTLRFARRGPDPRNIPAYCRTKYPWPTMSKTFSSTIARPAAANMARHRSASAMVWFVRSWYR